MKNGNSMDVELVSEILDCQPPITTYVQRTVNECFGDARLSRAANPEYEKAEKECRRLIKEAGTDDEPFMTWVVEAERAAYRIGVLAGLRLARREDLLSKVVEHI